MKQGLVLLHILLLTLGAYQGVALFYGQLFSGMVTAVRPASDRLVPEGGDAPDLQEMPGIEKYSVITRRNLFDVMVRKPGPAKTETLPPARKDPLPETQHRLILWGTIITASGEGDYAVIENQKDKTQALYQKGDSVEGAVIREIERSRVKVSVNGQDQVLEVDVSRQPSSSPGVNALPPVSMPQDQTPPPGFGAQGSEALDQTSVMRQVRVRPYASPEGTEGLLLYAVKKDSVVHQLGLQNGDIIQFINDSPIRSAQDMAMLYSALADALNSPSDSRFTIMRQGEAKEVVYNPVNNTYTVSPAADKTGPEEKP